LLGGWTLVHLPIPYLGSAVLGASTEIGYQGNIDRYIVPAGGGSGSAVYYQNWQQPV